MIVSPETISLFLAERIECPDLGFLGSKATLDDLNAAEKAIGCHFSVSYKDFLLKCGSGVVGPFPVFGTQPTAMYPIHGTVVDITKRYRQEKWPTTDMGPVISEDHAGNPIVEFESGEIVKFDHDTGDTSILSPSFGHFIAYLMKI
jgi:hypothetical protein